MAERKELKQSIKDRIILAHQDNKSYRSISQTLRVPVSTVGYIVKKWKESGSTKNMPRSGAPRKITVRCRQKILQTVRKNPFVTREELQKDLKSMGTSVCKRTISTELHRENLKSRRPRKTPLLKEAHLKCRLEDAKKGSSSKDEANEILRNISYDRGRTSSVKEEELPEISKVDVWDGKSEAMSVDDNIHLSDVELDDLDVKTELQD